MRTAIAAIGVLCICTGAAAQHAEHGGALVGGHVPREIIERPVPLRTGIGTVTHAATTASAAAQAFYEQGLSYLHSYVWIEAARSFNQALRLDPKHALAWVGLSRAFTGLEDAAAAVEAHGRATALTAGVTPREQRWIAIRSRQIDALTDLRDGNKRLAYIAAIDEALEHDPQDAELWTLRGNAEEAGLGAAGRGQRGGASSIVFYDEAIRRVPGHFGAHHYLIHSYEQVGRFEDALRHGAIYAAAASQVPHALHMYGHDLMKTGQIARAIEIFERARTLEQQYYAGEQIAREYDWHHTHNTALLALSHRHLGRIAETERMLADAASVRQPSDGRSTLYQSFLAELLIARGSYDAALEVATRLLASSGGRNQGHAFAARALMGLNRMDAARRHLLELPGGLPGSGNAQIDQDLARGEYLLKTGDRDTGSRILSNVLTRARRQRTPDGWIEGLFTLETIFHIARSAGAWDLARSASALLLDHDKAYGGAQYAAALVAEHDGRRAEAAAAFAEAARLWQGADPDFALVKDLRSRRP